MADRRGGMRTPSSPAPVSGPGALSRRTDGGPQQQTTKMTGMAYGENADYNDMQQSAPMSASQSAKSPAVQRRQAQTSGKKAASAKPLFSPTDRPEEPVTAGAPFGPGDGPTMQPGVGAIATSDAKGLAKYLPQMMTMAGDPNTPDGFKRFVRHLRNMQGA
jgi:hypothetical protein